MTQPLSLAELIAEIEKRLPALYDALWGSMASEFRGNEDEADGSLYGQGYPANQSKALASTSRLLRQCLVFLRAQREAELQTSSVLCDECNGRGVVVDAPGNVLGGRAYTEPCPKCSTPSRPEQP